MEHLELEIQVLTYISVFSNTWEFDEHLENNQSCNYKEICMNVMVTALKYNRVNFINGPVMARISNEQVIEN